MRSAICTAFVLATVAALPTIADEVVLMVSPKVIEFYNGAYKSLKPPRAIAVADDGFHFGYSYCPEYRCTMNPTARNLAMQGCVKGGGRGCRIFAIGDDIKVNYRVMDHSDLRPPEADVVSPEPTQPCVGKTQEQCQKIAADFAEQRKQIEAKWAKTIDQQRRFYCGYGYGAAAPCMVVNKSEADRDAELSALDTELRRQLTQ
jgi:hypothetical protein